MANTLVTGEFRRTLDERFRLSLPAELTEPVLSGGEIAILVKQRPGCLSVWGQAPFREQQAAGEQLVAQKIAAGRLSGRTEEVQRLGRLLSTRHTEVPLAGKGRLVIPEGFRDFLGVEAGQDVFVIGAAVCLEIWRPAAWFRYIEENITEFRELFDQLSS
jgi:MraZ protein